jgi:hypothetical protein
MQPARGPSPPQALDVQAALDAMEWDATDVSVPLLVPAGGEGESRDSARIPTGLPALPAASSGAVTGDDFAFDDGSDVLAGISIPMLPSQPSMQPDIPVAPVPDSSVVATGIPIGVPVEACRESSQMLSYPTHVVGPSVPTVRLPVCFFCLESCQPECFGRVSGCACGATAAATILSYFTIISLVETATGAFIGRV